MSIKQNLLLTANKIVMKAPFIPFNQKIKIRKMIMAELKASGFKGI
ncbi:hypothetical protein [Sulfuricurvum sp.]|nr:hypothetical protein [Sulfuricurvum sp.]HEX5330807.1 hypothetical protein [Sulfuricurvum sp.]